MQRKDQPFGLVPAPLGGRAAAAPRAEPGTRTEPQAVRRRPAVDVAFSLAAEDS